MANESILKQKEAAVEAAAARIADSKVVIAFDYQGLTVEKFETLRKSVREAGGEIVVLKNNISRRAAVSSGHQAFADQLTGPKAIVFAQSEIVAPAKAVYEFSKSNDIVKIELSESSCDNTLTITDITGKTVMSETVTSNSMEINVSHLSSGLYFIKHGNKVSKLAIE